MANLPEPVYNLVEETHPALQKELPPFDFSNPPIDPVQLSSDLHHTMSYAGGLGLAANQVGLEHRVFVLNTSPRPLTMFNPRITWYDTDHKVMDEGCLTYPNLFIKIRRPDKVRIRYQDETGTTNTLVLDGMVGRAAQHEYDHLNGIVHLDRASPINSKKAKAKMKNLKRKLK